MSRLDTFKYIPENYRIRSSNGAMRVTVVNNIPQTWAIARPVTAPTPKYSPPVGLWRAPSLGLTPGQPNVMMDPSDPQTWQRQYRFTV